MSNLEQIIKLCIAKSDSRFDLWTQLINSTKVKKMAEVGVYRGNFAAEILQECNLLEKYYMVDPWRHLDDWNKPANKNDHIFDQFLAETKEKTDFAAEKRIILRGKTTEVIEDIPDGELDFAYIDGDHTLKGITIDLTCIFAKIRVGGWIGGDDFSNTIWQHTPNFEPTLVFPFAVYFAEAVGATIYALPYSQFIIEKSGQKSFSFVDLTGNYRDVGLKSQFNPVKVLQIKTAEAFSLVTKLTKGK